MRSWCFEWRLPGGALASVVDSLVLARHQDRTLLRSLLREFTDDAHELTLLEVRAPGASAGLPWTRRVGAAGKAGLLQGTSDY